jgi:hypothetical protein
LCRHEKRRANGRPVGDGHSGRRREITEKGDFVFLSRLVDIYAEERSRMGVEIASQSSGWGRPSLRTARAIGQAVFNKYSLFFDQRLKHDDKRPFGTRLRCKRAQSSTRIRRGDREVGFVAHKYWELTVPLVAGGTAVRPAWSGRMGPVEYYTRRSHARCGEIAAADGVGSVRLLRVIRMRCRSAVPKTTRPPETRVI